MVVVVGMLKRQARNAGKHGRCEMQPRRRQTTSPFFGTGILVTCPTLSYAGYVSRRCERSYLQSAWPVAWSAAWLGAWSLAPNSCAVQRRALPYPQDVVCWLSATSCGDMYRHGKHGLAMCSAPASLQGISACARKPSGLWGCHVFSASMTVGQLPSIGYPSSESLLSVSVVFAGTRHPAFLFLMVGVSSVSW